LPNLSAEDQLKVDQANIIYDFVAELFLLRMRMNLPTTVENPSRVLLWWLEQYRDLIRDPAATVCDFHACMVGGKRDKSTRFLCFGLDLSELSERWCDKSHDHAPWQPFFDKARSRLVYPTADEAEYPRLLCEILARSVIAEARSRCLTLPAQQWGDESDPFQAAHERKSQLGHQPRGKRLPPLLSEFASVEQCAGAFTVGDTVQTDHGWGNVLRHVHSGGDAGDAQAMCGIFRTPQQFLLEAALVQHPTDSLSNDLAGNEPAIIHSLTKSKLEIIKFRVTKLKMVSDMRKQLAEDEARLHSTFPPERRADLAKKNLLLWKALLEQTSYQDVAIVDEVMQGFALTGKLNRSRVYPSLLRPASLTQSDLADSAKWTRPTVIGSCRASGSDQQDQAIWDATMKELDAGVLTGPFTQADLEQKFGDLYIVSRRFGVFQNNKWRPIDDFSQPLVNSAVQVTEKLQLGGVDEVAAMIRYVLTHAQSTESLQWAGRTVDLKAAYRQLAIADSDKCHACIAVYNPTSKAPAFFVMHSLPFGAVAAVYAFNRAARSLAYLSQRLLLIPTSQFYDDFTIIDRADVAEQYLYMH